MIEGIQLAFLAAILYAVWPQLKNRLRVRLVNRRNRAIRK